MKCTALSTCQKFLKGLCWIKNTAVSRFVGCCGAQGLDKSKSVLPSYFGTFILSYFHNYLNTFVPSSYESTLTRHTRRGGPPRAQSRRLRRTSMSRAPSQLLARVATLGRADGRLGGLRSECCGIPHLDRPSLCGFKFLNYWDACAHKSTQYYAE